jgi:hypothetical protein
LYIFCASRLGTPPSLHEASYFYHLTFLDLNLILSFLTLTISTARHFSSRLLKNTAAMVSASSLSRHDRCVGSGAEYSLHPLKKCILGLALVLKLLVAFAKVIISRGLERR